MTTPKARRRLERGSVLVEGLAVLSLCLMGVVVNFEMIRRVRFEVVFHHAAFLTARFRMLGLGTREARGKAWEFVESALGEIAREGEGTMTIEERRFQKSLESRWQLRHPAFLRFPYEGRTKHHYEVTKKCKFPYS